MIFFFVNDFMSFFFVDVSGEMIFNVIFGSLNQIVWWESLEFCKWANFISAVSILYMW